jgi:hypothetical protein
MVSPRSVSDDLVDPSTNSAVSALAGVRTEHA